MRLTLRDIDLLRFLCAGRWFNTKQIHRRFFPNATLSAVRRRLRLLLKAGYVKKHQENPMHQAFFTLGREGKRVLEHESHREIVLERNPPKQLDHLMGINDIRIIAERDSELSYFFAAWELPGVGWKHSIIPDAVFCLANRTIALEYDRGLEGLRYFVGSKIAEYRRGLPGFPLSGVLVVVNSESRRRTLANAIGNDGFIVVELLRNVRDACSLDLFSRQDSFATTSPVESIT